MKKLILLGFLTLTGCAQYLQNQETNDCYAEGFAPGTEGFLQCFQERDDARLQGSEALMTAGFKEMQGQQ